MVSVNIGVPPLQALSWWVCLVCLDAKGPPEVQWGWSSPQTHRDPTEILGGESPPKVDVAETLEWREGIWCHCDFGTHTQPNCCPSQML